MLLFHNDYNQVCHHAVLERVTAAAPMQMPGYGIDSSCSRAAKMIRQKCNDDSLAVHFMVGGTQTNLTVITAALRPHQAVIGAESAHINVHETGAVEATGHKVLTVPSKDGKITAQQVEQIVLAQKLSADAEHIAQPKMVYISNPTEFGTIYTLAELEILSALCKKHRLYLYADGARLGYGLAAADNDVKMEDLARLCDAFYIGGTKVGAMFGEAVVISNPEIAEDFRYLIKQRGGMLAKGWLLGLQFEALFENDLYWEIAKHADCLADRIRETLSELGYFMPVCSRTNQIFVELPNRVLEAIGKDFTYALWEQTDADHAIVRFCTSWATTPESVDALCNALRKWSK